MRLIKKTSQHRRDFTGIVECEHCQHQETLLYGYDDAFYHQNVIPKMVCELCGKPSPEGSPRTTPDVPPQVVI